MRPVSIQAILKFVFYILSLIVLFLIFLPSVTLPVDKPTLVALFIFHAWFWQKEPGGTQQ